ncbi:hypothetical protein [Mycolicibacterium goodii]|uniref:Uncharacterized protein n=1 Tax=Mycolicibacterium goodii TaxID=134601 RepID=A0A0K0XDP8_MYCGD|nr:hypothetical protein AFA91_30430 [Mycolicibacterium goodii]
MRLVNDTLATPVQLTTPTEHGFIVVATEFGRWAGPFPVPSGTRRRALRRAVDLTEKLARRDDVVEATVFRAALRPPGEGSELLARAGVRPARYDVVVLVRTDSTSAVDAVRADAAFVELESVLRHRARHTHRIVADNAARIADVDHRHDRWFLFNYFYCDDLDTVLAVWKYTAGWFQRHTALPDSTLLRPLPGAATDYSVVSVVNHASWPTLRTFLPRLLFDRTFRTFVLANFAANGVAAQPIIYRRAGASSSRASA